MKERLVIRDIAHIRAVMHVAQVSRTVKDRVQRHAPKLEQVDFLLVEPGDTVPGVGQSNEGDAILPPVLAKGGSRIRSHSQDLGPLIGERVVAISQARQLRATERSHEPAQERQQDSLLATKA